MNWTAAACWALLLVAAFLCDNGAAKGGRGGARGSARGGLRGGARGASRVRVRPAPRFSGSSARLAAAGAAAGAAGAAAGLAAGGAWRRAPDPGARGLQDADAGPDGNGTVYSYLVLISGARPPTGPRLCLLLGSVLGALALRGL
ncbi:shadow of prion protein [Sorex fumeus]|uniref:shadow of prion protein n=1 Tax=Sorex fumeus TaxID=62283 RepID=UPI0024AD7463|nr:shadow of prion protein [Sorex fumeus]